MARIYIVHDREAKSNRLVQANSQAQAIHHVVSNRYSATAATALQVADAMSNGAVLESANSSESASESASEPKSEPVQLELPLQY
jgi:hypothetical protein